MKNIVFALTPHALPPPCQQRILATPQHPIMSVNVQQLKLSWIKCSVIEDKALFIFWYSFSIDISQAYRNESFYQCCSGFCIDLLSRLAEELAFTYELVRVEDGRWGTLQVSGKLKLQLQCTTWPNGSQKLREIFYFLFIEFENIWHVCSIGSLLAYNLLAEWEIKLE